MRKFNTAIEADKIVSELRDQMREINFNKDLRKYLRNVESLVTELSKAEVLVRRHSGSNYTPTAHQKLEDAINYLEKMILIAKIMQ
jgi:hypothetical protein